MTNGPFLLFCEWFSQTPPTDDDMEIALIGLPQSGKTTLLNALTRGRAQSASSGSGRQDVQVGVAGMSDPRLDTLVKMFNPRKVVPAEVRYLDVPAGQGSAQETPEWAGIGGQFLNTLQGCDALLLVVRAFENPSVPHVRGSVDPHRDIADVEAELAFSDLAILERRVARIEANLKGARGNERDTLLKETAVLQRVKEELEKGVTLRDQQVTSEEGQLLSNYQFLTAKPLLIALNVDEGNLSGVADLERAVAEGSEARAGVGVVALFAKLELELSQLAQEDEREFRESMGLEESGVDRVVGLSHHLLSLVSFFTYGPDEVRAWSVAAETPAVKAAGKIHSDIERGFIRAEVMAFDDLARCGSVAQCKKEGLFRLEGKGYPIKDGDAVIFLFNV